MSPAETTHRTTCDSPIGPLTLVAGARGLRAVGFPGEALDAAGAERALDVAGARRAHAALAAAARQLGEYFAGERTSFDLELDLRAGTPFQRAVWEQLLAIPFGATVSYGELARRTGRRDRIRAVGAANGRNPLPVVVPCHRVVGADGRLTGYRGGLQRKRALLDHEGAVAARGLQPSRSARPSAATRWSAPAASMHSGGLTLSTL